MEVTTSNINTHYYKLAHFNTIAYTVYSSTDKNDQSLLELELEIRNQNPGVLITYYNKHLYHYSMANASGLVLGDKYPQLQITYSNSVDVETFTVPQKAANDEYLTIASMGFLKAVKKVLLYTLSSQEVVKIFGNYCIMPVNDVYDIIYLDPILFPNGDLLVSMISYNNISLLNTNDMSLDRLDYNYVLYLIPSGIRCHFHDNENIKRNFEQKKSNNESLIKLLKTSIGIDYTDKDVLWVKLIPNLKHLNNQTSKIAKFIHTVENRKFILWPWDLCVLQSGEIEEFSNGVLNETSITNNTLDLISLFLDFNIANNQQNNTNNSTMLAPLSNSSITSTGISSYGHINTDIQKDINSVEIADSPSVQPEVYNQNPGNAALGENEIKNSNDDPGFDDIDTEQLNDLDDLFGDGSDSSDEMDNKSDYSKSGNTPDAGQGTSSEVITEISKGQAQDSVTDPAFPIKDDDMAQKLVKEYPPESFRELQPSYIDIPKDKMTLQSISPAYNDPGAPLPIIPTPIIPLPISNVSQSNTAPNGSVVSDDNTRSIFSPLLFNPIIKSNIDTKYGKGGKFYVDKKTSSDKEIGKNKSLRATSVSGYEHAPKEISFHKNVSSSDSSEESDEDDDEYDVIGDDMGNDAISDSPPLKLNTFNDSLIPQSSGLGSSSLTAERSAATLHFNGSLASGSPPVNSFPRSIETVSNSPFLSNDVNASMSPMEIDSHQIGQNNASADREISTSKGESSNYLPLILRNINISTIPKYFLLNNLVFNEALPSFSINDDDNDNESDLDLNKDCELITKIGDIDDFLEFLIPNLIFDIGQNCINNDSAYSDRRDGPFVGFEHVRSKFEDAFFQLFPCCYRVGLPEFLFDSNTLEGNDEIVDQLNFLSDITNDEEVLDPKVKYQKLNAIEWNGIMSETQDVEASEKYKTLLSSTNALYTHNEEACYKLPDIKTRVMKNNEILNLNSIGTRFWKFLNFSPLSEKKNFQILLIGENWNHNSDFLEKIIHNYRESNFGEISKIDLNTTETRSDLESINNGLLVLDREPGKTYNYIYRQAYKKLSSLVELIKLDLINKTNKFEFDRPVLLLFVNFDERLNSFLQISSIFKHFKRTLHKHQVPLVKIFTKIIPGKLVVKKVDNDIQQKYLSNHKLTRLSMNLYNHCPNDSLDETLMPNLYTRLVKEPPTKIQFKFLNSNSKDSSGKSFNDDVFLHLAYERSIDKYWISSAWSDTLGHVTYTKSWYCSSGQSTSQPQAHDLSSICDDIWRISVESFKKIDDEAISKSTALGGRKFLVLTRVNSIIPDDELVHWKRLSMKQKDISLIVLSVNSKPKLVFENVGSRASEEGKSTEQMQHTEPSQYPAKAERGGRDMFFKSFNDDFSPINASGAIVNSPSNNIMLQSPHQFLNATSSLSPHDMMLSVSGPGQQISQNHTSNPDADHILSHPSSEITAIIPHLPLPSFNAPARLGMKMGYLLKEFENDYLVFEVSVLSCSNHWNLDQLMRLLLSHYKNMIVLNDILGLRDIEGGIRSTNDDSKVTDMEYEVQNLVPWHITAVRKSLDYLVHICVNE